MAVSKPIRTAVVGSTPRGFGDRAHLPALIASNDFELLAVCTTNPTSAQEAAERWNAPRWYAGVESLVADSDIELVTIAVRPRFHREIAEQALAAGKAVYCEWPLGFNTDDAHLMQTAAKESSLPTAVSLQGRFAPVLQHMRTLVNDGTIGEPLTFNCSLQLSGFDVDSDRAWLTKETEASGALFVATAHVTDAIAYVLGDFQKIIGINRTLAPDGIFSDTAVPFQWDTSDTVMYIAELVSGINGITSVNNISTPESGYSFQIIGSDAQLIAKAPSYYQFSPLTLYIGSKDQGFEEVKCPPGSAHLPTLTPVDPATNIAYALIDFANCIRMGKRFRPDFEDALRLHRIVDGIVRSGESGNWAEVSN